MINMYYVFKIVVIHCIDINGGGLQLVLVSIALQSLHHNYEMMTSL